jgi:ubiquinone/menaquinone biosynthesis C-methylase UbiE
VLTVDYELLRIRKGDVVLDLGCGEGRHSVEAWKRADCSVVAVDLDKEALAKTAYHLWLEYSKNGARPIVGAVRGDALRLPFPDACFDKIICSEMLEHIPDDGSCVREIVRVLKPGGALAVSVPRFLPERICWALSKPYRTTEGGHVRIYRREDLTDLLTDAGLRLEKVRFKHALHSFYWIMRCLFGLQNEKAVLPSLYHRFLVWDIMKSPPPVRLLERLLDPFFSKSIVLYLRKGS